MRAFNMAAEQFVMFHLCVLLLAVVSQLDAYPDGSRLNVAWEAFKVQYGRNYHTLHEELHRRELWEANLQLIAEHNSQPGITFTMGVNSFSDMTEEEVQQRLGLVPMDIAHHGNHMRDTHRDLTSFYNLDIEGFGVNPRFIPDSVDLREEGCINHVKDQGSCGSCYSFSAVGALESYQCLETGHMVSLSEQNIIECSWEQGNNGCSGGWMDWVFLYVYENGGIDTEAYYPYVSGEDGVDNGTCQYSAAPSDVGATCMGWVYLPNGDEEAMQQAIAQKGPVSIAYDVLTDFMYYESGVYSSQNCSQYQLNHAMLVVGYGTEMDQDYWLLKNSWGEDWGDEGYIKVARNMDNNCGIASVGVYPVVEPVVDLV